jgi:hypothetical protein
VPLFDPGQVSTRLKQRVSTYPPALRLKIAHDGLNSARFALYMARNTAAEDAYLAGACAARAVNYLVQALFAINRRYQVNDKTALDELVGADHVPHDLVARVQAVFAELGRTPEERRASIAALTLLAAEVVALAAQALVVDGATPAWLGSLDMSTL